MLGRYNQATGELTVVPVRGNQILRMEPRARGVDYSARSGDTTEQQDGKTAAQLRREKNAKLVQEFGSQRRKRQLSASKAAQVDASQVSIGDEVLRMISSAGSAVMSRETVIEASLAMRNIPPHNPLATTAEEAYPLESIIPRSIFDALEIDKLFEATSSPEHMASLLKSKTFGAGFVLSRLASLRNSTDDIAADRARCLAMLGHLIKLYTLPGRSLRSRADDGGLSTLATRLNIAPSVLEGILDTFYSRDVGFDGETFTLNNEKRNLLLGWILILAVRAEPHCTLDPPVLESLTAELKMRKTEVMAHYRELGCVTSRVSSSSSASFGGVSGGVRVLLMPATPSGEPKKTLKEYFPPLKLGARKPAAK
jgi:DNA-directed RNA polymerase I subunit RPA49